MMAQKDAARQLREYKKQAKIENTELNQKVTTLRHELSMEKEGAAMALAKLQSFEMDHKDCSDAKAKTVALNDSVQRNTALQEHIAKLEKEKEQRISANASLSAEVMDIQSKYHESETNVERYCQDLAQVCEYTHW